MAELRLVGVTSDGQSLLLADESGDQHTIVIDDRLRAGVNGHLSRLGQLTMALESHISPREIQERVRAGESAEHVAISAGVPVERVLRFVGPVLREREHVADQARRARLAGSNGPTSLLADLVARAATRRGADPEDVTWDSARREDHSWVVTVSFPDGASASWGLDVTRHQATPLDGNAREISGVDRPAPDTDADYREYPAFDPEAGFDARFDTLDLSDDATSHHNVRPFAPRPVPSPADAEADSLSADASGGLGQRDDGEQAGEPDAGEQAPRESVDDARGRRERSSRSSRRARVPKWDDIMFGPKSRD